MQQHISFLVRLWWVGDAPGVANEPRDLPPGLRITALNPRTGEQWGFTEWEQLLAFLQKQTLVQTVPDNPDSNDAHTDASGGKDDPI